MADRKDIVLAFSGGLDTSFCVPWLCEQGYRVITLFVDTGGVDDAERAYIEDRALSLGASEHVVADGADAVWSDVVIPMLAAGQTYQNQYPLLCSDRYVVVDEALALCRARGTKRFAHGCTGMGNDQVRFDLAVGASGDFEIISPVRELQRSVDNVREYEQHYLAERGHEVRAKTSTYTINQNLLGATISGSEIDRWETPARNAYQMTAHAGEWPDEPLQVEIEFAQGVPVALDGEAMAGPALLAELNRLLGRYGVGRGIYTGDTAVGLKGRIIYEAPGLIGLMTAHRALEEATSTRHQNRFKPFAGSTWVELVYLGFFHDPLKTDLEAYLRSSQRTVDGTVRLASEGGQVHAVAVESPHLITAKDAVYAQKADWSVEEARGFIKLFGQGTTLWRAINGDRL